MSDELLTIPQLIARIPGSKGAKRISPSTVHRWLIAGCPATDGSRVKLKGTRVGWRWLIRESDLNDFFAALHPQDEPTPTRTPTERRKASAAAARKLEAAGA